MKKKKGIYKKQKIKNSEREKRKFFKKRKSSAEKVKWRRNQQNEIKTITFSFPLKWLAHSNAHTNIPLKATAKERVCVIVSSIKRYGMVKYKKKKPHKTIKRKTENK